MRALLIAVPMIVAACSPSEPADVREWTPDDHGQPPGADGQRVAAAEPGATEASAESPEQSEARAASALWGVMCATCHGRDGRGGGPGLPPGANVPDFTSAEWHGTRTDEVLAEVIAQGRGLMPPFSETVQPQGIAALVRHLRRLGARPE